MAKRHWEDREKLKASLGSVGLSAHICWFLGVIFAVLGIIADAANTLGLEPTSWFLLAVVAFLASIIWFFGVALAWYLRTTEAKSKKEE